MQIQSKRHFVFEQPAGSHGYEIPEWKQLMPKWNVQQVIIDPCAAGKVGRKSGLKTKKPTDFRASEESLIQGLRKFKCPGNHQHTNLGGGGTHRPHAIIEKSSDHAEWPPGVCREL
eukprot:6929330-Karenia_brevis.AAC.1